MGDYYGDYDMDMLRSYVQQFLEERSVGDLLTVVTDIIKQKEEES